MNILVVKPSSLGDVIHALPFLKAVKDSFPEARIDWVISRTLTGILEGNPLIHELITLNMDSWKRIRSIPETVAEFSSLNRRLKSTQYDMVIDLQGLLRSGLIAYSAPTALKVGFADAREGSTFFYDRKVSVNGNMHAVDKCLEAAGAIGAAVNKAGFPMYVSNESKLKIRELLGDVHEYIVIVPSARWVTKRWPAEHFAALVSRISAPCVIAGSTGDRKISQKIIDTLSEKIIPPRPLLNKGGASPRVTGLCGKTSLKELAALISGAKAVVTNDSGPMHIAAALDRPTIAIFGPTDPVKTGPYGWQTKSHLKVIRADVPCSPCRRKRKCREFICMDRVRVDDVFDALKEFL